MPQSMTHMRLRQLREIGGLMLYRQRNAEEEGLDSVVDGLRHQTNAIRWAIGVILECRSHFTSDEWALLIDKAREREIELEMPQRRS